MKVLKKIYSLYDKKAQYYLSPFIADNDMTACRFVFTLYDSEIATIVEQCSEDFDLYCLGDFDNQSGVIESRFQPQFVCHCMAIFEMYRQHQNLKKEVLEDE